MTEKAEINAKSIRGAVLAFLAALTGALSWNAALALALLIITGLTEGAGLLMLIPLLQSVGLDVGEGAMGQLADHVFSVFAAFGLRPTLIAVLGVYVAITIAQALLARWQYIANSRLPYEFTAELRERLYRAIAGSSWLFFSRSRSSDFAHALTTELDRVTAAAYSLLALASTSVITLVYVLLALRLSPAMTLLAFLSGAGLMLLLRGATRASRVHGEELTESTNELYGATIEHLAGLKTVKGYNAERRNAEIFSRLVRRVTLTLTGAARSYADAAFWFSAGSVVILSIILYMALEVLDLPTATTLLLLFLYARIMPRFSGLQQSLQQLLNNLPAFSNISEIESRCRASAEPEAGHAEAVAFQSSIRLEQVSFAYDEARGEAVSDLDLIIEARGTTAIVGSSGAGKSTVADLILGLITPARGRILIDGAPLTPSRMRGWREHIGYVAQETFLFHDTVRANLLWACPEASDEQIWDALRLAAAEGFVSALPDGIETIVGDRGVRLSGGERQRIALARALLRKPSLLILDEATSALDSENENRIKQAIEELHGSVTILIITHRLFSIARADNIYLIEQGRVVESGSWDTLVSNASSRFRAMYEAQSITLNSTTGQVSEQSV
jgi:ATP-binding cassette subfamily C protein